MFTQQRTTAILLVMICHETFFYSCYFRLCPSDGADDAYLCVCVRACEHVGVSVEIPEVTLIMGTTHQSVSWATDLGPVWSAAWSMFTGVSCPTFIVTWPVSSGCVDRAEADPGRSQPKTNTGSRTEKTSGPLTVNMTQLPCSLGKSCQLWCNSSATTMTVDLLGALLNPLTIKLLDVRSVVKYCRLVVLKFDQTGAKFSLKFSFIC